MTYYDPNGWAYPSYIPNPNLANYPNQQFQQPMLQPQSTGCPLDNRFVWIPNKEMARTTPQAPDKTVLYMNENESYEYFRKTDRDGKTVEFRTFRLIEEVEPDTQPQNKSQVNSNVVTKDEFNQFSNDMQNAISALMEKIESMNKPFNKTFNQKGQVNKNA